MNRLLEGGQALWQQILQLTVEDWLLFVAVLILLQLLRIGRAARRSARHVAETKEQFAEINERVGIMLDRMVDAEERLLRMREIVDEAEQIQATTSGDDDTGTAPS